MVCGDEERVPTFMPVAWMLGFAALIANLRLFLSFQNRLVVGNRRLGRSRHPVASLFTIESPDSIQPAALEFLEAAAGIAVADRQISGMTFAEHPTDGLEACRRSATLLLLRTSGATRRA
ncbi:hypothetical protein B6S08_07410 [Oceanimonas doudoroffii]|uniref:Uncharacterized protein n=1 Tax=Oceanimonas doudoroffii TaxID=84158 RepID=A0A233RIT6_9GAMM|nr:hypothetical protein B6S08_07410 [Oceanimonas doudoroffii]